jgi:tRNA (adenine22-N1)-methyltransferase
VQKLSKRIQTLINRIPSNTDYLYDLCCDHGEIGIAAAKIFPNTEVVLVDTVASIIETLKNKVADIPADNLRIEKKDCRIAKFDFKKNTLFLLAGIGGNLGIEILENILNGRKENPKIEDISYLCCIHQNQENFKEYLRAETDLVIESNKILQDNNQFYEIILLSHKVQASSSSRAVEIFSQEDFNKDNSDSIAYLDSLLSYFKIKANHNPNTHYEAYYAKLQEIHKSLAV